MFLWAVIFLLILVLSAVYTKDLCVVKGNGDFLAVRKKVFSHQKIALVCVLVLLCLISGLRFETGGSDYFVYEGIYQRLPKLSGFFANISNLEQYNVFGHERLWLFIQSFFKSLGFSYNAFLFVHSAFFFICLYFFLKRYSLNPMFCVLVFLSLMYFYNTMISLRQSTVIAIFLVSLPLLEKRRYLRYFIVVAVCFFIHYSSLYLIILPFVCRFVHKTKKTLIVLLVISIPIIIITTQVNIIGWFINLSEPVVSSLFGSTFGNKFAALKDVSEPISIFHVLQYFLVLFVFILFFDEAKKYGKFFEFTFVMIVCLFPILVVFRNFGIFTRLKDFFYLSYGTLFSILFLVKEQRYKWLMFIAASMVCGFTFFRFIILFDEGHFMSYKSILLKG